MVFVLFLCALVSILMEMSLALRGVAPISLLCHPCFEVTAQPLNRGSVCRLVGEVG
jgi:hypothetical protein